MFKKTALVLVTLALLTTLASCSKYGDLKDSMDKMSKSVDTYVAENAKATDAKSAAGALNNYAKAIKDNTSTWGASFSKYVDVIANPPADIPADLKASRDKFTQLGSELAAEFEKVNTAYGTDNDVQNAFGSLYDGLKSAIAAEVDAATKLETAMNAANDAKSIAPIITAYTDSSRKALQGFDAILPLYPELSREPTKPQALQKAITDLGTINTKVVAAFAKVENFKTDADIEKSLEARYANLKTGIDAMVAGTEKFIADSDKAKDAKTTAVAIAAFADVNQSSQKSVSREVRLFPELQSKGIDGLPAFLGDPLKKLGTYSDKVRAAVTAANTAYVQPVNTLRQIYGDATKEAAELKKIIAPDAGAPALNIADTLKNLNALTSTIDKDITDTISLQAKGSEVLPATIVDPLKSLKDLNATLTGALATSNDKNIDPVKKLADLGGKITDISSKLPPILETKNDVEKAMARLNGGF